jgi:hypothetical protein
MRETLLAVAAIFLLAAWTPFPTAVGPEVPLDAPPYVLAHTTRPTLASNGNGALLLTSSQFFLRNGGTFYLYYIGFLDADGAPVGASSLLGWVAGASAASSGNGYLVTFLENDHMRAIRYSASGTRLDATPIDLGPATTPGEVAWDGGAYVAIAGSRAVRIGEDGRILVSHDVAGFTTGVEVASHNGVTVLVDQGDDDGSTGPIHAFAIDGSSSNVGNGRRADVAAGGPGFLVVWESASGGIIGRILDPAGRPDGPSITIATGTAPGVAWNGTEWLVVYQNREIRGVRVLRAPLAPSFRIAAGGGNPAAAAAGSKVVVAWDDRIITQEQVHSATVEGEQVSPAGPAARVAAGQSDVRMTVVDGASLVAWYDGQTRVRRMDGSPTQTLADAAWPVAFEAGGNEALLVTNQGNSLAFTRVDRNGAPLSTHAYTGGFPLTHVDAAWTGNRWVVVFRSLATSSPQRIIVNADGTIGTPRFFGSPVGTTVQGMTVVAAGSKAFVLRAVQGTGGGRTMTYVIDEDGTWRAGRDLAPGMLAAASRGEDVLTARIDDGRTLEWQRVLLDGTVAAKGEVELPETGMKLQAFFTGENYLLLLTKVHAESSRIDLYGFRVDVSGAPIDLAPERFAGMLTSMQPFFHDAILRGGTTVDVVYSERLDRLNPSEEFTRLTFRSVHDMPRRRVVR